MMAWFETWTLVLLAVMAWPVAEVWNACSREKRRVRVSVRPMLRMRRTERLDPLCTSKWPLGRPDGSAQE